MLVYQRVTIYNRTECSWRVSSTFWTVFHICLKWFKAKGRVPDSMDYLFVSRIPHFWVRNQERKNETSPQGPWSTQNIKLKGLAKMTGWRIILPEIRRCWSRNVKNVFICYESTCWSCSWYHIPYYPIIFNGKQPGGICIHCIIYCAISRFGISTQISRR